jgi:hypothetical protein
MKSYIIYALLFVPSITTGQTQSRLQNLTLNTSYPISIGDNFLANPSNNFNKFIGIFALSLGYECNMKGNFYFSLDFKYSYLYRQEQLNEIVISPTVSELEIIPSMNLGISNPSVGISYDIKMDNFTLTPKFNIGYSLIRFYREQSRESLFYYDSYNGFTTSTQMKLYYSFNEKISMAIYLAYENSFLDKGETDAETSFNKQNQLIQLLYPGIELKIRI